MKEQSINQRCAAFVWKHVEKQSSRSDFKDVVNATKAAPALIMSNGLMATLAFYQQKENQYEPVLALIVAWLNENELGSGSYRKTIEFLSQNDSATYMRATESAMLVLRWARQLAAAHSKAGNSQ